jgi:dual specificity protein kinase YAK1
MGIRNHHPIYRLTVAEMEQDRFFSPNEIVTLPRAGDVVILEFIDSGTFGQIFKVVRVNDPSKFYALKVTSREIDIIAAQTMNEIRIYLYAQSQFNEAALQSIGRMVDYCNARPDYLFILMDLYNGCLLSLFTPETDTDPPFGLNLRLIRHALHSLSRALSEMERLGIRHTDIKPENIMIDCDGNFRLIDFGGARMKGILIGTYVQTRWYRAPEVALGGSPTCAADMWSVGAVLAEMFVGRPVFAGGPKAQYLRLLEVRLGPFPPAMIAGAELFVNGRVKGVQEPVDDSGLLDRPLRRLLAAVTYDGDPEEAKEPFIDLVMRMLRYDPEERIKARDICEHPFLQMEFPPP